VRESRPTNPRRVDLAEGPPEVKPLSKSPINSKMSDDAKIVFDTVGKLAGLTVIFDPDFQTRRIPSELTDPSLEQALDIVISSGEHLLEAGPRTPSSL
jgi:general secretion pathway protein D